MIGQLTGILRQKNPPTLLIECHGVGYEVEVPMSTLYTLPEINTSITLLTHLVVREDAHLLYGFAHANERLAFRTLIKTSGVGTRTALAILSGLSFDDLVQCVRTQNSTHLIKVPGIGKKTAERLLLELKGKFDDARFTPTTPSTKHDTDTWDIEQALVALGYNPKEAHQTIKALPSGMNVSEGIKWALRYLNR